MEILTSFAHGGETLVAIHNEKASGEVVPGVWCDVYSHPETGEGDLGIITIKPGKMTPLQRVEGGDLTIEGHISGEGVLTVTDEEGKEHEFRVSDKSGERFSHEVKVGEKMRWKATGDEELVVFEVCYPPYEEGRFTNIEE